MGVLSTLAKVWTLFLQIHWKGLKIHPKANFILDIL